MFSPLLVEEEVYLIKNLASDLGGLLGFYMGISFITMCEIFGFFFEGILLCCGGHLLRSSSAYQHPKGAAVDEI